MPRSLATRGTFRAALALAGFAAALQAPGAATAAAVVSDALPDLAVRLSGPRSATAGDDVGRELTLIVENGGSGVAWGTTHHAAGYVIDLTLGSDRRVAIGLKAYSPYYREDVLLQGGRVTATFDLAPGRARTYGLSAVVPHDTDTGRRYLCAYVDPGNAIVESDEKNNHQCIAIDIVARSRGDRSIDRAQRANTPVVRIARISPPGCVDRGGTAVIHGEGLGSRQGTRLVELGGHGIGILVQVTSWTPTQISILVPDDPRVRHDEWYYLGIQDRDRNWISNIDKTIRICQQLE